jgi:hypothetical protein
MKTYIQEQGLDVWRSIVDGYKAPTSPSTDRYGKKLEENDSKDTNAIDNGVNQ